jgi:hypothetical protein
MDRYNSSIDKVLPWAEQKGIISDHFFRYERSNKSITVLKPGVYFIQVTLSADTNSVSHGQYDVTQIKFQCRKKNNIK